MNDTITTVITTMLPSTPKRRQLTRDERLRIQTLREGGWEIDVTHAHLRPTINNLTMHQVEHACRFTRPTPRKRSGRPELLNKNQKTELIAFVRTSKISRRLTYFELAVHFELDIAMTLSLTRPYPDPTLYRVGSGRLKYL
jgi:hypothetical protein